MRIGRGVLVVSARIARFGLRREDRAIRGRIARLRLVFQHRGGASHGGADGKASNENETKPSLHARRSRAAARGRTKTTERYPSSLDAPSRPVAAR